MGIVYYFLYYRAGLVGVVRRISDRKFILEKRMLWYKTVLYIWLSLLLEWGRYDSATGNWRLWKRTNHAVLVTLVLWKTAVPVSRWKRKEEAVVPLSSRSWSQKSFKVMLSASFRLLIRSFSPRRLTSSLKKCPFYNWLINNILYLFMPLFWGTQKFF